MATPASTLPLATVSDNGKAPKSRVENPTDAQQIVQSLIYAGRDRARFNAKGKGMLDGNAPFDAAKLRQLGQSYRCNVNFMEGDAALSAALVPYYDLFAGAQTYAKVKLYLDNPDEAVTKSQIATEEFDCLLKKYADFEFNMDGVLADLVGFGRGFTMFPNEWGWHFQHVEFNRIFVPDGTKASIEQLEIVVVREKMQVHKLWNYIQAPKATEAGWDKNACTDAIREAMPEDRSTQTDATTSYEYVQQRMRDRDITEGTCQPTVPVAHLLVKEFNGKITHLMVEEVQRQMTGQTAGFKGKDGKDRQIKFLFKKQNRFDEMRHVLCAFFFETQGGSWNGARGLVHKVFSSIEIKNRLLCKIVDNAFLSSGITLAAKDANSLQKTSLIQAGDLNIIPPGYEVQNAQIFARSDQLIGTNQLLDQTISSNTGIFKAKPEKPQGNPETATAAELRFQHATVLTNSGVSRFYQRADAFYTELFRRVTHSQFMDSDKSEEAEQVREFLRRCKQRGVTVDDLKKVESVQAVRNIGNGSQFQRQQSLERFTPYVPMLTEGGRQAWMQDLVAAEFGQAAVERYIPEREKQLRPNDQQAMAMLENAALRSGAPVAWTPTQNNAIHATEHLKAMSGAAESLQQGVNPVEVLAFLEAAGAHTIIHLQQLSADKSRKAVYEVLTEEFKKIAKFTDELADTIAEQEQEMAQQQQEAAMAQQQAQAIQDGTDPDTQIKRAQAEADMALKQQKQQHSMMLKQQQHNQKTASKDIDLAQRLKTQAITTAANLRQQQIETAAKLKQQQQKAATAAK